MTGGFVRYRLKVFLLLTAVLFLGTVGWQLVRDRGYTDERAAWAAVRDSVALGQARIDSLKAVLDRLDEISTAGQAEIGAGRERIAHFERRAEGGQLPAAQHRQYERAIASHNEAVARYNVDLARMQGVYREYSDLVDAHNALVDSANAMQRRATQEGYGLPEASAP